jgi:hypothetical protein
VKTIFEVSETDQDGLEPRNEKMSQEGESIYSSGDDSEVVALFMLLGKISPEGFRAMLMGQKLI